MFYSHEKRTEKWFAFNHKKKKDPGSYINTLKIYVLLDESVITIYVFGEANVIVCYVWLIASHLKCDVIGFGCGSCIQLAKLILFSSNLNKM